jgi:cell filamentation protein
MSDTKYCYPDSDVLKNKFNIRDKDELFRTEVKLTTLRVRQLQDKPIKGKFDFNHLKSIHKYIFQDIYDWAGKERTVDIGKGNLFCTVVCIQDYAKSVFGKYFSQCFANKDNKENFVRALAENYGDLNALHPFREGNGRAQREFARVVCLECGYDFDLSCSTQKEMLMASKLSFDKGDNTGFISVFSRALTPINQDRVVNCDYMKILTADDLNVASEEYENYGYEEYQESDTYNKLYEAKIEKMNAQNYGEPVSEDNKMYQKYADALTQLYEKAEKISALPSNDASLDDVFLGLKERRPKLDSLKAEINQVIQDMKNNDIDPAQIYPLLPEKLIQPVSKNFQSLIGEKSEKAR